ncbi:MAG: PGPGW domain-containing protein [Acidimicrobiia bacterium]
MKKKPIKSATRIAAGGGLILIGIPMLVLPGPGLLTIFAGITVVSSEFEWAERVVKRVKDKTARLRREDERSPDSTVSGDQTG